MYEDTEDGAIELLNHISDMDILDPERDRVLFMPDPQVRGVWLIAALLHQRAFIVYTNVGDFEEVDFDEALEKYFPHYPHYNI